MQSSKSQANIEVIFQNLNNAPNKNPATRSAVVATPLPLNSDSLFAPCGQMIMAFFFALSSLSRFRSRHSATCDHCVTLESLKNRGDRIELALTAVGLS